MLKSCEKISSRNDEESWVFRRSSYHMTNDDNFRTDFSYKGRGNAYTKITPRIWWFLSCAYYITTYVDLGWWSIRDQVDLFLFVPFFFSFTMPNICIFPKVLIFLVKKRSYTVKMTFYSGNYILFPPTSITAVTLILNILILLKMHKHICEWESIYIYI